PCLLVLVAAKAIEPVYALLFNCPVCSTVGGKHNCTADRRAMYSPSCIGSVKQYIIYLVHAALRDWIVLKHPVLSLVCCLINIISFKISRSQPSCFAVYKLYSKK